MPLNKPALRVLNNTNFPNNNAQYISPALLREFNEEMITSLQLTQSMSEYAQLSGGNAFIGSQSIDGYVSIDKTKALNTNAIYWNNNVVGYTNLEIVNSSPNGNVNIGAIGGKVQIVSSSLNITNGTFSASLENGYAWVGDGNNRTSLVPTSSFGSVTSAITASSLITASFSGNTLTFTKGDSSTFGVVIPDVSGSTIPAGTISGSSQITALGFVSSSVTGSSLITGSVSGNVLTFTKGDGSGFSLTVATGSGGGGSTDTGSLLVTASFDTSTRNITFTKGDATQFNLGGFATTGSNNFVGINNFSGSAGTGIINIQNTGKLTLGGTTMPFNESGLISMVAGDGTNQGGSLQFQISNGGSTFLCGDAPSGSTQSVGNTPIVFENNTRSGSITFTNSGNTGQIRLQNNTGSINLAAGNSISISGSSTTIQDVNFIPFSASLNSRILAATGSGGGGGGATLGANTFTGSQTILTSSFLRVGSDDEFIKTEFNTFTLNNKTGVYVNFQAPDTYFQANGNFAFQNSIGGNGSGSMTFQIANGGSYSTQVQGAGTIGFSTNTGSISFTTPGELNLQSRVLKLKSADASFNTQIVNVSGSLMLIAQSQSTASAHIAQASPVNSVNLIFKPNNNTGATIVSGSSNIYTNAATPTTGYTRYIGGSNNLYLNQSNGINSQITQSAASVSGNRPTMNGNIMPGTGDFAINQANNPGTHTYSSNIIFGQGGQTLINALGFTGSLNVNSNISSTSGIVVNAASASIAQIATGISGSGTVTISSNLVQGGSITNTSPRFLLPTNTQTMANNVVAGSGITVTNISSSAAVNSSNNFANSVLSYTNAGAAGLGLHTSIGSITNNYGGGTIIASGSAVAFNFNTTSGNNLTVTNQAWSGSLGVGQFSILRNIFYGQSMTLLITGSVDGASNTTGPFTDNAVIGKNNTIFSNQSGAGVHNSFISNVVGGERLIISASNSFNSTIGGGAYFGRWNADDGVRNKSGQTVFSVGTGISGSRKTGFLIDSGSNTFVEGTLNVSGSTSTTGSITIQSGSGDLFVHGNKQFNVGAFNSTITQSGSAAVSQSMTFNNTDITQGVTLNGGGTQLTLTNSGTYNIQFSAQLLAATGQDDVYIWLKKNGTNVSNTGTKLVLANNEANVAAWNFVVPAAASDYFELVWQNRDGHTLLSAATATGNIPAIPSVIVTVTQVR